jgi:SAM-dependent methyltransferase
MNDDKMPAEHYRSLRELENAYWWHQTRYRLAWRLLQRYAPRRSDLRVADVGCGTGGFLRHLQASGIRSVVGFDYGESTLRFLEQDGLEGHAIDLEQPFRLAGGPYDVVCALDVMEHVDGEAPFLDSLRQSLEPKALLILTLPAHAFLFSRWDRKLRHFRRYSRAAAASLVERNGFRVLEASYFFSFVFPMALLRRWTGSYDGMTSCEFPPVSANLNRFLLALGAFELRLLYVMKLPFGTSLYLAAERGR